MSDLEIVFLIGAGRSGTKFLRDLLATDANVNRVPFDIGYLWRYGNETLVHDEIAPDSLTEKHLHWIRETLPKLAERGIGKENARILIEKSVPNSLRPALLYRAFPNAKFIHLVRDGHAVTESAVRLWKEPADTGYLWKKIRYFPWANYKYALWFIGNLFFKKRNSVPIWGPRYNGIQEDVGTLPLHVVCAKQWAACLKAATEELSRIPLKQVLTVRYEELTTKQESIVKIASFVGLNSNHLLGQWAEQVRPENNDKWQKHMSAEVIADIERVFESLGARYEEYWRG